MPGDAKRFLTFNKDEIFKSLLAVEGHLRQLKPEFKGEDLRCLVKHLGEAESHADEAVSHTAELKLDVESGKFKELRDRLREFRRKLQSEQVKSEDAIREIRSIRGFFESFNPEYNVSSCKLCGDIEEVLAKLNIPKTTVPELESESVDRLLAHLAAKYNVPKPKVRWLEKCPTRPESFGVYRSDGVNDEIVLCRGGTVHVVLHEFGHYLARVQGKPSTEAEAEAFALKESGKALNVETAQFNNGGKRMTSWREIGVIYGGQHIGKGISRGLKELDRYMGKEAAAVQERPSTWVVVAGAVGLPLLAVYAKLKDPWDKLAILTGGFLSTNLWDIVEEAMVAAGGAAGAAYVPARYVPPVSAVASAPAQTVASAPAQTAAQEKVY